MNALVFDFDGEPVRFVSVNGRDAVVGSDAARCLGIENHRNVFARTPDDEKGVHTVDTLGGKQETVVLFEAGVYRLIFESRKPAAERFKTWVFNDVLPAIRKAGRFGTSHLDAKATMAALALVRQAQRTFGPPKARALWRELGLPDPKPLPEDIEDSAGKPPRRASKAKQATVSSRAMANGSVGAGEVSAFLAECCERGDSYRVGGATLAAEYNAWAMRSGRPSCSPKVFGPIIKALGVARYKSSSIWYLGIRLRPRLASPSPA